MVKVIIVYESKYGNTKTVAETIAEGMNEVPETEVVINEINNVDLNKIGEFDAIIIGAKIAYLIESKWDQSRMPDNVLQLNHTQHRRHQILRWFHRMWHHEPWNQFIDQFDREFYDSFQKHIASEDSLLSANLQTILTLLAGKHLVDVLLFFYQHKIPHIETSFQVVTLQYKPTIGNYIDLAIKN